MNTGVTTILWTLVTFGLFASSVGAQTGGLAPLTPASTTMTQSTTTNAVATFGGGCFWCVEAVFQELDGVKSVASGYAGGQVENPTYKDVCTATTGHAEVVQIHYDPAKVRFEDLLEVFFKTHDPTTKDRQGNDSGPQYRSVVFYHDDAQKQTTERIIKELTEAGAYSDPIVTEVSPAPRFYKAEDYHQNYFKSNPFQGYCMAVVAPKVEKFRKVFASKLKKTR